jgi:phage anti-repressor protein
MEIIENGLVPIYKHDAYGQAVNARDLHKFLGVEARFNDWIARRIEDCRLKENEDWVLLKNEQNSEGRPRKEYALTMDASKLVSMMERSDKGDEIRRYFLAVEKAYHQKRLDEEKNKHRFIEAFIREVGPYRKIYPQSFYEALYGLIGWEWHEGKYSHPGYIGRLTNQLIYTKLAPGIYEELDKRNPYQSGRRRRRWIQTRLLTDEIGKAALKEQIDFVTKMALASSSIDELLSAVDRYYLKRFSGAKQLSFLRVKYELVGG